MKAWVLMMTLLAVASGELWAEAPPDLGAQKEAVRLYPELAQRESDFNKRFNDRLRVLRGTKDALLDKPNWPLMIAHQVARDMVAPPPAPAAPAPAAQTPGPAPAPAAPAAPAQPMPAAGPESSTLIGGLTPKGPIDPEIVAAVQSEKVVWDSTGHAKAKGVRMTLRYPNTWRAEEGSRPHIVQKFVQNSRTSSNTTIARMVMVQAQEFTEAVRGKLTAADKEQMISREATEFFVPAGVELISHRATKLDGEPCAMLELAGNAERLGVQMRQRAILYVVPRDNAYVCIHCSVVGDSSGGGDAVDEAYAQVRPLFFSIAGSCVFTDKWKEP